MKSAPKDGNPSNQGGSGPVEETDDMAAPALRLVPGPAPAPAAEAADPRARLADEELFALTRAGERDAFEILVKRYEEKAVFTARAIVGSLETAREVAQDAFLKVYANRDSFDVKRRFSSWFYRILRNQAVDRVRRQASGTPGAAVELVGDWSSGRPSPLARASADERRLQVHRILSDLPAKFRTVLALRDLEGLPCNEIAERVGTTAGTVRWRLHHARKLFREQWERLLGREEGDEEL